MKKQYHYYLFDLDGTVTDSSTGITNSIYYALQKLGIPWPERKELYKFIGPPMVESFQKFYGMTYEEAWHAIDLYREYYNKRGIYENRVYDGLIDVFMELKNRGEQVALATSKPEEYAVQILDYFNLTMYFDVIAGSEMDYGRSEKKDVIEHALSELGVTDRSQVLMIGDREQDVIGAKNTGVDSLGVLYGFGSRKELEDAGATYIAETVGEILDY